jgi:NTP pyrophosphatase (non-canonical NTP hydrolase)
MDIQELQKKIIEFRYSRDWVQYHNPKDLAISLMLEAAELLELFQWKDPHEVEKV